ncbi:hypothetical protein HGRIS_011862 [Hohenbuehelia grisea]|uniref:Domain of unknown function at the cortex 1 domain-containing protein n=1 Tax=Hohenbuehelia grisea TaxID=104357 RepID=A0ABR3JWD0_9AGAR
MPRLRVLAGPSPTSLTPITDRVNTTSSHTIQSDHFHGQVVVNIKGFDTDAQDSELGKEDYFGRVDRQGITWSIQVQGRFLTPCSADDVLFGNTFDRPLKLPWGSGAALKFMRYIDPVLEHDLSSSSRPWALSPLIATMPHFTHHRLPQVLSHSSASDSSDALVKPEIEVSSACSSMSDLADALIGLTTRPFPPKDSITDDLSQLHEAVSSACTSSSSSSSSLLSSSSSSSSGCSSSSSGRSRSSLSTSSAESKSSLSPHLASTSVGFAAKAKNATQKLKVPSNKKTSDKARKRHVLGSLGESGSARFTGLKNASDRRTYFSNKANREAVVFGPEDVITTDFCYGFLEFTPRLALTLPGGLSFDLMRFWDGQPVRFVCCERKREGDVGSDVPWGRTFWCVVIELEE